MKINHQCQQTCLLYYTIVITVHYYYRCFLSLSLLLYYYYFLNTNENILKLIISIRISIENPSLYSHKYKETSQ